MIVHVIVAHFYCVIIQQMGRCVVPGCNNTSSKGKELGTFSIHTVPSNELMRARWWAWLTNCRVGLTSLTKRSFTICSEHFNLSDFKNYHVAGTKRPGGLRYVTVYYLQTHPVSECCIEMSLARLEIVVDDSK